MMITFTGSVQVSGVPPQADRWPENFIRGRRAAALIEIETNERRTSNIERPTSNIVFCHNIKRLGKVNLSFENLQLVCFKIGKAQRRQYWMFNVGRSMFDVQSFQC